MTTSPNYHAPVLRVGLAAIATLDLISFPIFLTAAHRGALEQGVAPGAFAELVARLPVSFLIASCGVAAAFAFARRPGRLGAGLLTLLALALLSSAHAQLFGSPWRHLFYSGLCLAGWLLGLSRSRHAGAAEDEAYARTGAIALLGAAYLNAGISKVVFGGGDWISGVPIQAVVLGQDGLVGDGALALFRTWVVSTPAAAALFSIATVLLELAGPLMLVGKRSRFLVASGLLAMHLNIFVLTGGSILYWEAMVFLVLFGLSTREPSHPLPSAQGGSARSRAATLLAAAMTLAALLAIAHQTRRFTSTHEHGRTMSMPAPPAPTIAALREIGPFRVGQTIAAAWSIDRLEVVPEGFIVRVAGPPGRAHFEITCAPSEHDSPFDIDAAHIFYSDDLPFETLRDAGAALRDTLRDNVADGADVCAVVRSWRGAAQAGRTP